MNYKTKIDALEKALERLNASLENSRSKDDEYRAEILERIELIEQEIEQELKKEHDGQC